MICKYNSNRPSALVDASGTAYADLHSSWWIMQALPCDTFLVMSDSYLGIIDANGNWLVRALRPLLGEDIKDWELE